LRLNRNIKRANRLITYNKVGFHSQCPCNANPLQLAAAQLMRLSLDELCWDSNHFQKLSYLSNFFLTGGQMMDS
jgi:hypothetical protein